MGSTFCISAVIIVIIGLSVFILLSIPNDRYKYSVVSSSIKKKLHDHLKGLQVVL